VLTLDQSQVLDGVNCDHGHNVDSRSDFDGDLGINGSYLDLSDSAGQDVTGAQLHGTSPVVCPSLEVSHSLELRGSHEMSAKGRMRKMTIWFLMIGSALDAGAVSAADTDPCAQFTWDVSHERSVMKEAPRIVAAAIKPGADVPQIQLEEPYEVKLSDQSTVTYAANPGKATLANGAHAGLVRFRVEKAGKYRVSITSAHWIDIVDATQLVSSKDFQGQQGCDRPHKVVEYELPAGRDLTLQFSGSTDAEVIVAITAVVADVH